MKQILLVDILAILRNNETIYLYESPNNSIGSFRVDRLLVYFSDSAILNREVWPKSYRERLPGFVDKVLEYYGRWEDGELDMDKLKEDLWEYGGIRLEPAQIDMEDISKNNEK